MKASKLERSINGTESSLSVSGLTLSKEKTQFIVFSLNNKAIKAPFRSNHIEIIHELNVAGMKINNVKKVKFLGLIFQFDFNWTQHLNAINKGITFKMKILRCLGHTWWGAVPRTMLMLVNSLIRSKLEHASFLLHDGRKVIASDRLDKMLLKALKITIHTIQSYQRHNGRIENSADEYSQ